MKERIKKKRERESRKNKIIPSETKGMQTLDRFYSIILSYKRIFTLRYLNLYAYKIDEFPLLI